MCMQNEKFLFYMEEIREVINNSWTFHLQNKKEIRKVINNS
jgi:hypothetical protein